MNKGTIGERLVAELERERMLNRNLPNYSTVVALIDEFLKPGLAKCSQCHEVAEYWAQQYPQDPIKYRCERCLDLPPECKADLTPADFHSLWEGRGLL